MTTKNSTSSPTSGDDPVVPGSPSPTGTDENREAGKLGYCSDFPRDLLTDVELSTSSCLVHRSPEQTSSPIAEMPERQESLNLAMADHLRGTNPSNGFSENPTACAKPKTEDQIRKLASEIGLRPQIAYIPAGNSAAMPVSKVDQRRKKDKASKAVVREEKTSEGLFQFNRWIPAEYSDALSNLVVRLKSTSDWANALLTDPVNESLLRRCDELEASWSLTTDEITKVNTQLQSARKSVRARDEEIKRLMAKNDSASSHANQIGTVLRALIKNLAEAQAHLFQQQIAKSRDAKKIHELEKQIYESESARIRTEALYRETLSRSAAQQQELVEMRPLYVRAKDTLSRIDELEWVERQWRHIAAINGWRLTVLRIAGIRPLPKSYE